MDAAGLSGGDPAPVAIVTGAARGIGQAVAHRLAADGWALVLVDLDPDLAGAVPEADAEIVIGSVSDPAVQDRIFEAVGRLPGALELLVNNAGVGGPGGHVSQLDGAVLEQVLSVNLHAPFALSVRAGRAMMGRRRGRIVTLGSVFGQQAVPEAAPYCISKGALTQLTQALAVDLGPHGITANTVAPGYILTDMHHEEIEARAEAWSVSFEEAQRRTAESVPLRRHGTPDDVAAVVAWLAGPDSAYVTGQTIAVNGGMLLS